MPFKLRLKKSRQYNVVSKSLFVIGIELLDSTNVECTLATESLGRECLDNVCQKLSFQQPEFFGLRYVSHSGAPRWVELDRPLKRQLDKRAMKYTLYLRIMYYVSGINLLTDEMTRYHYFLQLKSDVIEGRIKCNTEQAILLASYSMQAEFGDHDVEKHTPDYLKEFVLFPKHIISGNQSELTEAVICQHAALAGLPQGTAEEYYILAAQQLEGYGLEMFVTKDNSSSEVTIGISLTGIIVKHEQNHISKFYKWRDITNVINHKRYFGIECQIPEETVHYQFPDVESAKYVWRMCVHQHTFCIQYGQSGDHSEAAEIVKALFSRNALEESHMNSSHEELDDYKRDEPMLRMQSETLSLGWGRQKAQSTSCLDLTSANSEVDRLRAMLPSYRLAPDYETAVQQKYHNYQSNSTRNANDNVMYSSHPDIHAAIHKQQLPADINLYSQSIYNHYPDVAQVDKMYRSENVPRQHNEQAVHTYSTPELDCVTNNVIQEMQMMHLFKPPPPYPINRPSSNSTPDLASQRFSHPSHYFISSQVSGSSPDLVSSRNQHNRPYANHTTDYSNMLPNPDAHRTYTNLSAAADSQQKLNDLKAKLDAHGYMNQQNVVLFTKAGALYPPGNTNISEPIYENVPLPWSHTVENGIENRSRASSIQSAPEMNSHGIAGASSTMGDENGKLANSDSNKNTMSSTSVSSSSHANSANHSVNTSIDSSQYDSSHTGTLGKDKGKGRRKWGGILGGGGANKHKSASRHEEDSTDNVRNPHVAILKQPLPTSISKEAMCQLIEKKLEDSQLIFEFEKIPRIKVNADFGTALMAENVKRNRHKDILPYEENRVRLSPTKENKYGYINASNITATVGNQQKFYIAAQSPMQTTVHHFWQMIWEADVYLVVSLTDLNDCNTVPYFHRSAADKVFECGEIWSQFSQETGHCITSKLRVYHTSSRRSRAVWHLQYNEWVTDGCPKSVAHFLGFLEELSSVRLHTGTEIPAGHNRNPPVLVHCCSGVGRSAVTILSDLLLYTLDHNQELDIARVVLLMRYQRMLMIETVTQYRFVYSLLAFYLKNSRLI